MPTDADFDPAQAILRWTHAIQTQATRLLEDVKHAHEANGKDFEAWYHSALDARADHHFLLIAARQLSRALTATGLGSLPNGMSDKIRRMRDVLEHWDEFTAVDPKRPQVGRAGREYRDAYPDGHPLADLRLVDGDIELGYGLTLLELDRLAADLEAWINYPSARIYPPLTDPPPPNPLDP